MRSRTFRLITGAFVLLAVLVPSAVSRAGEEPGGKMVTKRPFAFFLPAKWRTPLLYALTKRRVRGEQELSYTKDGFLLDTIQFKSRPITQPFGNTKKALTPGMAPYEVAQLVINDLELSKPLGFKVLENRPVTVCGRPGFRIVYSYNENGNLAYQSVYYGFLHNKVYYTIRFEAPAVHYYDTYLPTFEKMVQSASLIASDGNDDKQQDFNDPGAEEEGDGT